MGEFRSRIVGTGHYLPEKKLSNQDLEQMVETNDQWIRERTGIRWRSIAEKGVSTSDLALRASERALEIANVKPTELDLIIVATASGDYQMPTTSCMLQKKLGAGECMAMDVSAVCSGFIYALSVADQYIRTGTYKRILVVGAEVLHPFINFEDRETCILFGDGAGAVVLAPAEDGQDSKVYSTHLHADGKLAELLVVPGGGSVHPFDQEVLDKKLYLVKMRGREIFKHAVRMMAQSCQEALKKNHLTIDDVDWVIPHQANLRIIEAVGKQLDAPQEKVIIEIEDMGNTSAATVVVAMDRAIRDGRIRRGQNILLTAFGSGITYGAVLLRY